MVPVNDNVVFTDTSNDALTYQRVPLLTLLDLPRPEVLMNAWSYQASSPNGKDILHSAERVRDLVSAHNDALVNSIQYGWDYLSRQMKLDCLHPKVEYEEEELGKKNEDRAKQEPGPVRTEQRQGTQSERTPVEVVGPSKVQLKTDTACADEALATNATEAKAVRIGFFDHDFYDYITQKFVADRPECPIATSYPVSPSPPSCLNYKNRALWGFCPAGKYCLGFTQAFQPVRPNLTSILMGAIASNQPLKTILTTIGCMEGKYEVYGEECFKDRPEFKVTVQMAKNAPIFKGRVKHGSNSVSEVKQDAQTLNDDVSYEDQLEVERSCIRTQRRKLIKDKRFSDRLSCEVLDAIALEAQETCGITQTFPMSCFTIQAGQSFSSSTSFSTFTLKELNELAEEPLARNKKLIEDPETRYGTKRVGLLRAAVADFLFNYKMSQEFPQDFVPYDLQHSAQELNAELNPLVVAFNQDVAAFSRHLSDHLDQESNQNHFFQVWRDHKSFLSDGIVTIRGIGGLPSSVDTITQNFFDATQAQSLSQVLNNFTAQGAGGSGAGATSSSGAAVLSALEKGTLNPTTAIAALAALTPPATQARIGRQLTFNVTPFTLPGASSAELAVTLNAGEDLPPNLYQAGNTNASDTLSRVARHNVSTRVRVESVKMFELSAFSALIQRPRSKFPLLPPFIELPFIGNLASVPLPGAKEYHRSTAIVSAVIVPTAADLAYGIDFAHDRLIDIEDTKEWNHVYKMRSVNSLTQFSRMPIRAFHKAMVNCFASNGELIFPPGSRQPGNCGALDFRTVPPEF
jgi:hypothetical protein